MFQEKLVLGTADYVIFGSTLALSAVIGIYFQFATKKKSNDEYLLAGKDMSILPVSFSLMATFMSATTLMGIPAEMYLYGTNMAFMNLGITIGPIISAYVFLPVFFAIKASTAYEYLERRFGKATRKITSGMFALQMVLFTAVTLYAPALALSAVTNLSIWLSIISIGIVCTFYCSMGGMKAVIWADLFQAMLMYVSLFAVAIKGCLDLGGVHPVFEISKEGGRLVIPKFSLDFTTHYTMFNVFLQGTIITVSSFGGSQVQVQRLLTLKNLKRAQIATILSIPMIVVFHLLCCFCGLIVYAYFKSCDPLSAPNKPIHSPDQVMPYFITSSMNKFPGLPGLCVAGIFSASLSSASSCVNCLAAITSEDFIRPFYPKITEAVYITKTLSFFYGALCIGLAFIMSSLGNLVKITLLLFGMVAGPNLGIFILATCTTTANQEGTILGAMVGIILAACLSFIPEQNIEAPLPLANDCPTLQNLTTQKIFTSTQQPTWSPNTTITAIPIAGTVVDKEKFPLAYMWISSISMVACLVVGFVASAISRWMRGNFDDVPELYLSPVRVFLSKRNCMNKTGKLENGYEGKEMNSPWPESNL